MQYTIYVIEKLEKEWILFKKQLIIIIIGLILAFYIGGGIGRNAAYYRNVQGPRLKDLGYELIPEINDQYNFISEVILWTINVIGFGILLFPIFHHPQRQTLSTIHIAVLILNLLVPIPDMINYFGLAIAVFGISYVLYYTGKIGGGDLKLFTGIALLVPYLPQSPYPFVLLAMFVAAIAAIIALTAYYVPKYAMKGIDVKLNQKGIVSDAVLAIVLFGYF